MKPGNWIGCRHILPAFRRLMPGYDADLGTKAGADKHAYSTWNPRITKLSMAIIAVTGMSCVGVWWYFPKVDRELQLTNLLRTALAESKYDKARDIVCRLIEVSPENQDYLWWSAAIEEKRDQPASALAIRTRQAHRSYGPAVLWLADRSFHLDSIKSWSKQDHQDFLTLMSENSRWSTDTMRGVHRRLAAYWTLQGELAKATESLSRICQWEPAAHVDLATLYLQMGDRANAETSANQAQVALQARMDEEPGDAEARLQLVRALTLLHREKEAMSCLAVGFELTRQPAMQQAAGEVLVSWARRIKEADDSEATYWPRLQMIHRATQCAPQDTVVLAATLELIQESQLKEDARMQVLREATARGIERTAAHWMLGWLYAVGLQEQRALQHLRLAMDQSPEIPTVLNNLTIYLLDHPEIQQEFDLTLANLAIELLPDQGQFLETRGRVFMANRRWEEAITDLLQALTVEKLQAKIYPQLTTAYREIGDIDAAACCDSLHRRDWNRGK